MIIQCLRHLVAEIQGLENQSLWCAITQFLYKIDEIQKNISQVGHFLRSKHQSFFTLLTSSPPKYMFWCILFIFRKSGCQTFCVCRTYIFTIQLVHLVVFHNIFNYFIPKISRISFFLIFRFVGHIYIYIIYKHVVLLIRYR